MERLNSIPVVSLVLKNAKIVAPSVGLMSKFPILAPPKSSDSKSISMTQLLSHTFAHLTGPSFRLKAKLLPNKISLGPT